MGNNFLLPNLIWSCELNIYLWSNFVTLNCIPGKVVLLRFENISYVKSVEIQPT